MNSQPLHERFMVGRSKLNYVLEKEATNWNIFLYVYVPQARSPPQDQQGLSRMRVWVMCHQRVTNAQLLALGLVIFCYLTIWLLTFTILQLGFFFITPTASLQPSGQKSFRRTHSLSSNLCVSSLPNLCSDGYGTISSFYKFLLPWKRFINGQSVKKGPLWGQDFGRKMVGAAKKN